MNRTFTQQDLILFLYDDLSHDDRVALVRELQENPQLMNEFENLQYVRNSLGMEMASPSPTSVNIILEESLSSYPELS